MHACVCVCVFEIIYVVTTHFVSVLILYLEGFYELVGSCYYLHNRYCIIVYSLYSSVPCFVSATSSPFSWE